jgi:hypothetical protein
MQILVINGINASPLMFAEDNDHFHCILRGNKRIVLVNTAKYPDVRKVRFHLVTLSKKTKYYLFKRLLYQKIDKNLAHLLIQTGISHIKFF